MDLERLDPQGCVAYIPQFAGEREKAAADPDYPAVVLHLRPMTAVQYEGSARWVRRVDEATGLADFALRPETETEILTRHVARIENLRFAGGAPIADGAALAAAREHASAALAPLFLEVLAAVRDISVLREGERKN